MGVGDHPSMNERNAANEAAFKELPAAGSPAYWARLEDTTATTRLPLEVLVMCARERLAAGRRDQAEQVLQTLWIRIQRRVRNQILGSVRTARDRAGIIEDIMQECIVALWQEIAGADVPFLTRGFWRKMHFLVANATTKRLIAEGLMIRRGVQRPDRVQQDKTVSLDKPVGPDEDYTIGESVPDPHAQDAFQQVEFQADMAQLTKELTGDQRLLLRNSLTGELTQAELGDLLGITDRAVRMRLKKLHDWLRRRFNAPDSPDSAGEGGARGGEEG